ncbi:MAG: sugar phosphate isomerase/epimerase [Armatimonadetes bacterium]|nr:sugar phosphate isomerase/epimerase [Armatimonadota bacterium]
MRMGRMNNPAGRLSKEIAQTAALGFDYLELTLEPPKAASHGLRPRQVRRELDDAELGVVGHTAFYLPITDPFPRVRQAAVDQLRADLDFFAAIGCPVCTVHAHRGVSVGHTEVDRLKLQADSFARLTEHGDGLGVQVLLENTIGFCGDPDRLAQYLFEPLPSLGLTLDVAHAGLGVAKNRTPRFLELLGCRLRHVHISDNDTQSDLHQPLGTCRLPLKQLVQQVRATGYDAGFTLEVFGTYPEYVEVSRQLLARWWADG